VRTTRCWSGGIPSIHSLLRITGRLRLGCCGGIGDAGSAETRVDTSNHSRGERAGRRSLVRASKMRGLCQRQCAGDYSIFETPGLGVLYASDWRYRRASPRFARRHSLRRPKRVCGTDPITTPRCPAALEKSARSGVGSGPTPAGCARWLVTPTDPQAFQWQLSAVARRANYRRRWSAGVRSIPSLARVENAEPGRLENRVVPKSLALTQPTHFRSPGEGTPSGAFSPRASAGIERTPALRLQSISSPAAAPH
jgi:hypothetical protein